MSLATLRSRPPLLEVRPDGVAAVRRSGRRPHRLLMFGGGVLAGVGLRDHNLGLPGHVADALVGRSGRGADIDVIVDRFPTSMRALGGLRGLRLRRYDAVLVFVGDRPVRAGVTPDRWQREIETLVRTIRDEASPCAPVIICDTAHAMLRAGTGPLSRRTNARSDRLSAVTAGVAESAGVSVVELTPVAADTSSIRLSATTYGIWADVIASRLYGKLLTLEDPKVLESPAAFRSRPDPERPRQKALAQMRLAHGVRNPVLDSIVAQARIAFGTRAAQLNIIDGDLQRTYASSSAELSVTDREESFCDHTIRTDLLTLVNDSHCDARFQDNPRARGEAPVRFYAGYPIHSWDGFRIGALCIFDSSPRNMMPSELNTLRDFAGRIEQEIWSAALRDVGRPDGAMRQGLWM